MEVAESAGLAEPFLRGIACSCPIDVMFRFPAGWGQRRRTPARTDLGAEVNRFRGGVRPISVRNWTDFGAEVNRSRRIGLA